MKNLITIIFLCLTVIAGAQTSEDIEMITLINKVRTNPKSFIPTIESYIKSQDSILTKRNAFKNIKVAGAVVTKSTNNGNEFDAAIKANISEAKKLIFFLHVQKSVKALSTSEFLYPTALAQAKHNDSIKTNSHTGVAKCLVVDAENCGTGTTPMEMLLACLIDRGVEGKGHRVNIFNPAYTKVNVAHSGNYWTQDFGF